MEHPTILQADPQHEGVAQMSSPKHLSDSDPDPAASARPQSANPADAQEGAQPVEGGEDLQASRRRTGAVLLLPLVIAAVLILIVYAVLHIADRPVRGSGDAHGGTGSAAQSNGPGATDGASGGGGRSSGMGGRVSPGTALGGSDSLTDRTVEGATGSVVYAISAIDHARNRSDTHPLSDLMTPECEACSIEIGHIDEVPTGRTRTDGMQSRGVECPVVDRTSDSGGELQAVGLRCVYLSHADRWTTNDGRDTTIDATQDVTFDLVWQRGQWRLAGMTVNHVGSIDAYYPALDELKAQAGQGQS
ncbi:hypothetical protein HMPREF9005_0305 [Actinomyces sp. oral taxon 178 str. F0338]|uniref:Uncharacterized protein n=2 Tax=Pauljensenia hongkongensis TaxID=178339 RepID=A0A1D8B0S2_9ACTO|nr:hypothetical protein BH719_01465 [Pauljensenia hongkongensis]EFW10703.1 hypothetical protein HMPREF9005_0305 [Actinomyces sp. oral taxon 178 str. F0338]